MPVGLTVCITNRFGRSDASGASGARPNAVAAKPTNDTTTTVVRLRLCRETNFPLC